MSNTLSATFWTDPFSVFRGRNLKARALNLNDELWDRRLGVRTFGFHPARGEPGKPDWYLHYTPAAYCRLFRAFEIAGLGPTDHYVDVGSGMGRSVFAALHYGARHATGVEIVPSLSTCAEENKRAGDHANATFHCMNATEFAFDDADVVFFFHTFGADTMRAVLPKMRGRTRLRIIYMNPVCASILDDTTWLEPFATLPEQRTLLPLAARYEIRFWRARG